MARDLSGMRIAILVAEGFEQVEMTEPRRALDEAGAQTVLVSPEENRVRAWKFTDWGDEFAVDLPLDRARAQDFDAYLQPGGVMSPDKLRMDERAVKFARDFFDQGKPVAAICHGPWMLVEVDQVRGRTVTSWPSLKTDLRNAGATWVDQKVVRDGGVVTSRKPDDIPAFNEQVIELFAEGRRGQRAA